MGRVFYVDIDMTRHEWDLLAAPSYLRDVIVTL